MIGILSGMERGGGKGKGTGMGKDRTLGKVLGLDLEI